MSTRRWRGNAPARQQVVTVTIRHVENGVVLTLTNGGKSVTTTSDGTNTTTAMAALAAAWNAAIEPQFSEITALASGASLTLTADNEGVPFDVTATQSGTGGNVEVKTVTINHSPTGGTWSWVDATYGTAAGLAYNISAASLTTALEVIYGAGNVVATGSNGGPFTVTFAAALAHVDIPDTTFTTSSLTGGDATVTVVETVKGAAGTSEVQTITFYGTPSGGTFTVSFNGFSTAALAYNISAANLQTALRALTSIGATGIGVSGSAGGPYTCTFAGTLANTAVGMMTVDPRLLTGGSIYGTIATTTPGVAGVDEVQFITLSTNTQANETLTINRTSTVSGGTFRLSVNSGGDIVYTSALAYDAKLYQVCDALEIALATNMGTAYDGPYFAPWHEAYANLTIPQCLTLGANLAALVAIGNVGGANISQGSVIFDGLGIDALGLTGGGSYSFPGTGSTAGSYNGTPPTAGTFTLSFGGYTTAAITLSTSGTGRPDPAVVQSALEGLASIGVGNVSVEDWNESSTAQGSVRGLFKVTFQGALAGVPVSTITGSGSSFGVYVYTLKNGEAGTNEAQTVTLSGTPSAGTFTLTYEGETTAPIAYNASASTVDSALELLSTIPAGGVTCSGGSLPGSAVTVTFTGSLQYTNVSPLIIDDTGLKVIVTETTPGVTTANEVQTISLSGAPFGGTATLTYSGQTTAAIAWNASAGTIQTRLLALSNLTTDKVTVTGGPWPDPVQVTFVNGLAATDVAAITGSGTGLANATITHSSLDPITYPVTTANSGPSDWQVALNWTGDTVPITGDTVVIDQGDIPILYHLDQSAVILADLQIAARYVGTIGLPEQNQDGAEPYFEFRPMYLKIGSPTVSIGHGDGGGSRRIKLDLTPSTTPTVNVYQTDSPIDDGIESCLLLTPAGTVLNASRGSIGVGIFAGETSTVVTTRCGFETNLAGDVTLRFGSGVTWTTIEQSGGKIVTNSAGTTVSITDGEWVHYSGAVTTASIDGGAVRYNSTGTLTTANVGSGGVLDFRQDLRAKTVTNLSLYEGSSYHDPHGVVVLTNGADFVRCTPADCTFEVKPNQTWTPSVI